MQVRKAFFLVRADLHVEPHISNVFIVVRNVDPWVSSMTYVSMQEAKCRKQL